MTRCDTIDNNGNLRQTVVRINRTKPEKITKTLETISTGNPVQLLSVEAV